MNVTLSVDEEVIQRARQRAEAMGTSVNQIVRDYLAEFAHEESLEADLTEFRRLSLASKGDRRGWKFNREELHDRELDRAEHQR